MKWAAGIDTSNITFRELASHTGGLAIEPGLYGGIYTTTGDLARFIMAQYSDSDRLAKKYREMMQTIQTPEEGKNGYGLGLNISYTNNGSEMVGHNGSVAGYTAFMLFNPGSKVGAIVMRNCDDGFQQIPGEMANVVEGLARLDAK